VLLKVCLTLFISFLGALKGSYQIISIKSMNSILVATVWPEILDLVENWILYRVKFL